jgi:putative nucleotidyltransferase with HDIG domain
MNQDMHAVSIEEILDKSRIDLDLYIQLSKKKFILVAKAGAPTAVDQMHRYVEKNVHYLYVRAEDYLRLIQQTISVAGVVLSQENAPEVMRLNVLQEATEAVLMEIEKLGFNEAALSHARMVSDATLTMISGHSELANLIEKYRSLTSDGGRHAMFVSSLATMIGVAIGWTKPATLEKIALGGLLHDIGKTKLPADILSKSFATMSFDDRAVYQAHCEFGRQIVKAVRGVPDDVALMVYEHHEMADGTGYPRGIKDLVTSPMSRVVILANAYADLVFKDNNKPSPRVAEKAVAELEFVPAHFNKEMLRALRRLLNDNKVQAVG